MSGSSTAQINHNEKKAFLVKTSSLKDVRTFCREVFEKLDIDPNLKDELVLAIAEAAQNIVKHAYKDKPDSNDIMVVEVSCMNNELKIAFYDRGTPVDPQKVKHRELDNVKPGEYIAIISPPIITPINTIMIGSIKLDMLSTVVSNSSS